MQRNVLDESRDYLHVESLDAHEAIVKNLEPVQCTELIDEVHQPPLKQRHTKTHCFWTNMPLISLQCYPRHFTLSCDISHRNLGRSRVGRPGEQLVVSELRSCGNALGRTRAVVNVELAVRVGRHGEQFKEREPILGQFDHAELDEAVSVVDDAPLERQRHTRL